MKIKFVHDFNVKTKEFIDYNIIISFDNYYVNNKSPMDIKMSVGLF